MSEAMDLLECSALRTSANRSGNKKRHLLVFTHDVGACLLADG